MTIDFNKMNEKLKEIDGVLFLKLHPLTKDVEVEMANNTFFKYKLKMPFKVKKYEILRKPINK